MKENEMRSRLVNHTRFTRQQVILLLLAGVSSACSSGGGAPGPDTPPVVAACGEPTVGAAGSALREYYFDQEGQFVSQFLASASYTAKMAAGKDALTSLQSHSFLPGDESTTYGWADHFGEEIRGFIKPPKDGTYTFWVAGDNQAQFYLSPDKSTAPVTTALRATPQTPTAGTVDYVARGSFAEPGQRSMPLTLRASEYYYFGMYHMAHVGNTFAEVRWSVPGETPDSSTAAIVPGTALYYPEFPADAKCP